MEEESIGAGVDLSVYLSCATATITCMYRTVDYPYDITTNVPSYNHPKSTGFRGTKYTLGGNAHIGTKNMTKT